MSESGPLTVIWGGSPPQTLGPPPRHSQNFHTLGPFSRGKTWKNEKFSKRGRGREGQWGRGDRGGQLHSPPRNSQKFTHFYHFPAEKKAPALTSVGGRLGANLLVGRQDLPLP